MQTIILCTRCGWRGVNHLHSSPIWCYALGMWLNSVDNTNVCHFPTLHPNFPIWVDWGWARSWEHTQLGQLTLPGWRHITTLYIVIVSNKNGQRNKERGALASKMVLFQRLAGINLHEEVSACLCITCLLLFPLLINLFSSQLNFSCDYFFIFCPPSQLGLWWLSEQQCGCVDKG